MPAKYGILDGLIKNGYTLLYLKLLYEKPCIFTLKALEFQ